MSHSVLSASASARWLRCPPSARLCESLPQTESVYATEGTNAHALCAYKLGQLVGQPQPAPLVDFDEQAYQCADDYVAFVAERIKKESQVLIEQKVDFSKWAPEGFGTADCIVLCDGTMHIIDYKHGMGVPVSAEDNSQLKLYALGALDTFGCLYDINTVELSIFQPRISNSNSWELSVESLMSWANEVLKPMAQLAFKGEGDYYAGQHCRFCAAKNICRARAEANLAQCRKDFALPPTLSNAEVAVLLPRLDEIIRWASDLQGYALDEALKGEHFDGYKLVAGRSVRKYTNDEAVAEAVIASGADPYEKKLLGVTAMTKLLGSARFNELLGDLITKTPGKPTLVPETDKRKALNAADDFRDSI